MIPSGLHQLLQKGKLASDRSQVLVKYESETAQGRRVISRCYRG